MVSYRFLRPDDSPLIVDAINRCMGVHDPAFAGMNLDQLKLLMVEQNLWASSCMVALEDRLPVAALVGAKRQTCNLIYGIGTHPDHLRRGMATHLLKSLIAKLAIVGPHEIIAEVPSWDPALVALCAKLGFSAGTELIDLDLSQGLPRLKASGAIEETSLQAIAETDLFLQARSAAWARQQTTLLNAEKRLKGLVMISAEAIEALLVFEESEDETNILLLNHREGDRGRTCLMMLICALSQRKGSLLRIPKIDSDDPLCPILQRIGFLAGRRYRVHHLNAAETDVR